MSSNNHCGKHHEYDLNGECNGSSNGCNGAGKALLSRRRAPSSRHHGHVEASSSIFVWQAYKEWVYRHESKLHWMDEIVSRLLWWLPVGGGGASGAGDDDDAETNLHHPSRRWPREVLWGLLQLHRLFVDLALEEKYQQNGRLAHSNGTTLRLQHQQHGLDDDIVTIMTSQHRIRVGLDIIQSLWPVALELAAATTTIATTNIIISSNNSMNSTNHRLSIMRRQAAVALVLERARFILKLYFLLRYWKQWSKQQQQQQQQQQDATTTSSRMPHAVLPGILQMGGLLTSAASSSHSAPNLEQEQARLERANYVGRRTGRRVVGASLAVPPLVTEEASADSLVFGWTRRIKSLLLLASSNLFSNNNKSTKMMTRLVIGELLYIFRPLFWAQAQWDGYNHEHCVRQVAGAASTAAGVDNPILIDDTTSRVSSTSLQSWQWKAWLISLGMDVASLMSLSNMATASATPTITSRDPTRRRLRHHHRSGNSNPATVQEWNRRRLRLLLYLLRSPVWEVYTERRITDRISRHVPLVGNLLAAYLQDWLYYWKVYRAEEG
jgi:Peroxisomal membrane protein (Pex16)